MTDDPFAPDCDRCAGLCCIALAFDEGPSFAHDKPAGLPCHHLGPRARCAVHADLAGAGYSGCVRYDCRGAGQIVVQQVFDGRSWQDEPSLAGPMIDAFAILREVQDLRAQLAAARRLPLDPVSQARRDALDALLAPPEEWSAAALATFDLPAARAAFDAFARSLRGVFASPAQMANLRSGAE